MLFPRNFATFSTLDCEREKVTLWTTLFAPQSVKARMIYGVYIIPAKLVKPYPEFPLNSLCKKLPGTCY